MIRRLTIMIVASALAAAGCSNLGLGEADCTAPGRDFSSSNLLNAQAVPSAKYTPCLNELRLGWDSVDWFAEDGRAGIAILRTFDTFLIATVTESCDVSGATPAESGYPDIERYENVEFEPVDVEITIVPSGERPLLTARLLARRLAGQEIDGRPVVFAVDEKAHLAVSPRVTAALAANQYVWIIEEDLPELFYRGHWYFTFEGGCITYEFDANGTVAETVAADAEDALGFYPAFELRKSVRVGGVPLAEYVETLEALVTEMAGKFDAGQAQIDETPTIETARVVLAEFVEAVAEFQAGAAAADPPAELAELHAGLVDFMAQQVTVLEAFAARAETASGLEELEASAEARAYAAISAESESLCREFRSSIEETAADPVFDDAPWIPTEIQEVVDVAFRCS